MVKTFYVSDEHHKMVAAMAEYDARNLRTTVERAIEAAFKLHPLSNTLPRPEGGEAVPVITVDAHLDDKGE